MDHRPLRRLKCLGERRKFEIRTHSRNRVVRSRYSRHPERAESDGQTLLQSFRCGAGGVKTAEKELAGPFWVVSRRLGFMAELIQ